jgi:hypothetical protein
MLRNNQKYSHTKPLHLLIYFSVPFYEQNDLFELFEYDFKCYIPQINT